VAELGVLIMFGISDGVAPILSYNFGFGKQERVEETLKLAYKVNFVVGAILFSILFFAGRPLVSLFVEGNSQVINLATQGSKLYAFAFLIAGFNIINSGYFTAVGNAKASIIISGSRGILFIIVGIYILPMIIGINGVWLTVPFAEGVTFLGGLAMMKGNREFGKVYLQD